MVQIIKTKDELVNVFKDAGDKLVVIDFFATWCGPCRTISPFVDDLAEQFKDKLVVVKIDVDIEETEAVVTEYKISMMPTFVFVRHGSHLDTLSGANESKLKELIDKHIN